LRIARTVAKACCSTPNSSGRRNPFIFDPGQAMPLFAGDDFKRFI
jgi:hypothetical protein